MASVLDQRAHVSMDGQGPSAMLGCVNPSAMITDPVPMEPVFVLKGGMGITVVLAGVHPNVLVQPKVTVFNRNQSQQSLNRHQQQVTILLLDPTTITGQK